MSDTNGPVESGSSAGAEETPSAAVASGEAADVAGPAAAGSGRHARVVLVDDHRMFRTGVLGTAAGWEWYRSNSLFRHTIGTAATGGVTVTGANQSGNILSITGTATQTLKQGDKFSILNVNGVNPSTRRAISSTQTFTVLADVTLTGGTDTVNISPAIYGPGSQYQNVDAEYHHLHPTP